MSNSKSPALQTPALTKQEHRAIVALSKGEATESQQVLALQVIVKKFSQPNDLLFIPGSPDETGFINGRAFVASRIRYYVNAPVDKTRKSQ